MRFLFKYPTRQRPEQFKKIIRLYRNMLSNKHTYRFVITMDEDDGSMNNASMREFLDGQPNLDYYYGHNKSKVEAINADVSGEFDILVLLSDDMVPQLRGFDDVIATLMQRNFPGLEGCLHFDDGRVGRRLNTLSIMGKQLYDYFGYIYHPDYISLWCDNEFQQVTESLNKSVYIDTVIIKHDWESLHNDPLNRKNESYYFRDRAVFEARKAASFPRESISHTLDLSKIALQQPRQAKPRPTRIRQR